MRHQHRTMVIALCCVGCSGNDELWHHKLTLVSMSSGAVAYKQAVGSITMAVEVRDPKNPTASINETFDNVSLELGIADRTLYADTECHADNKLKWSLASVDGTMKTPNGTPQQRPSWKLETRKTLMKQPTTSDESNGGLRRSTMFGIDMRANAVQILVTAVATKCGDDGKLLVIDDPLPEEELPPDAGPPEEMLPDAGIQ